MARGEPTIRRIDDNLNLVNRTLASQTALGLRNDIGRSELLRRYRRHRKLYERRLRARPRMGPALRGDESE